MLKEIVLSGIGVVSPFGVGTDALLAGLLDRRKAFRSGKPFRGNGAVPDFDPSAYVPNDLRRLSRPSLFAVVAAHEALRRAGRFPVPQPSRTSIFVATCHGAIAFSESFHRSLVTQGPASVSPATFSESLFNVAASHISITLPLEEMAEATDPHHAEDDSGADVGLELEEGVGEPVRCNRRKRASASVATAS